MNRPGCITMNGIYMNRHGGGMGAKFGISFSHTILMLTFSYLFPI